MYSQTPLVAESDKLPLEKIRENLQTQLSELESLESVFYNPGEIRVEDACTLSDIRNFVNGRSTYLPQCLDLTINLVIENSKFELCVTLPHKYPCSSPPEIFVRNHTLNRPRHVQLNKDLTEYVNGLERGEPCIYSVASWLQENTQSYLEVKEAPTKREEKNENFVRYWIYSHHIYSKTKRREIVDLADELHISGFCMPGKLGLIVPILLQTMRSSGFQIK